MKIEELLNRYFEGKTSCTEELELRKFFRNKNIPEQLRVYRPLFLYLDQEVKISKEKRTHSSKQFFFQHRLINAISGIAAGILVIISIAGIWQHTSTTPSTNYVIINGKRYTDINLVRQQAFAAFQDVKTSEDETLNLMFE
ncbi:MAG: hypothetical protein LKI39_06410 [Bacteroides sp.]|jgi:hypothetical protein|nr:hypothetical protein [Bacteroides sp.]MCI1682174.1 hypothetical protein [Bacteroides sp.]